MSILKTIKRKLTPSPTLATTSNINPTDTDALDSAVLPLLFLQQIDHRPSSGYVGSSRVIAVTRYLEDKLEANNIQINRYTWSTRESYGDSRIPYSTQLAYDIQTAFHEHNEDNRILVVREHFTRDGTRRFSFNTTNHTDHYINQYFEHSTVDRDTIERLVAEAIDELNANTPGSILDRIHDHYVEQNPEKYLTN